MKLCITAEGKTLDAKVDPRFGRCKYFIIVDTETGKYEAIDNPGIMTGGAGIQAGELASGKNVTTVLTGNIGPNAFQVLTAAKIAVIVGVEGTVQKVIERFKKGEYATSAEKPSVDAHFGQR